MQSALGRLWPVGRHFAQASYVQVRLASIAAQLLDVTKSIPTKNRVLFEDVTLNIPAGAKIGVIGPNGTGKSTLLRILAGMEKDFDGDVRINEHMSLGFYHQEPQLDESLNVEENVLHGMAEKTRLLDAYNSVCEKFADENADHDSLMQEQERLEAAITRMRCWDLRKTVRTALTALRCPDPHVSVKGLSGGEQRRVALCRTLIEHPDILLLDEPTNHLDAYSVAWLEHFLMTYRGTVIGITHDRYFLEKCCNWIIEVQNGSVDIFKGNYSRWLEHRALRMDKKKKRAERRGKILKRELEWIKSTPKERHRKNTARLAAYDTMLAESKKQTLGQGRICIPTGPRLSSPVLRVRNVSKKIGDRQILNDFNFDLEPGHIVGVIGPNGAGKSTFMNIIAGVDPEYSGTCEWGESVKCGLVAQSRASMNDNNTVAEEVVRQSDASNSQIVIGEKKVDIRRFLAQFNFRNEEQDKMVGHLSGGERNRLHLCKVLCQGCNVLLLDEPSNDLDCDTLRSLEEALMTSFVGSAVVISHDPWFLDRVCTHILAFDSTGKVDYCIGNYTDYCEARLGKGLKDAWEINPNNFQPLAEEH
eukprot:Rmarinus@m.19215